MVIDIAVKEVLEIGANVHPQAKQIPGWENAHVLTLDIDAEQHPDIVADAAQMPDELENRFDGIFASHVLEHFSYWKTDEVLSGWARCLKPGGELHILVPSWEWAAREVLSERPSPAVLPHSFAGHVTPWDVHLAMFTMRKLRHLFEKAGLSVTHAKTMTYQIRVGSLGEFPAEEHYICGVKGTPELKKE